MTPQQIEAMKLALEALVMYGERHRATYLLGGAWDEEITLGDKAITALEEALAQPEQEPVACDGDFPEGFDASLGVPAQALRVANAIMCDVIGKREWDVPCTAQHVLSFAKKYTTPPQRTWVGLTDEDMYVVSEEESCSFIAVAKWSEEILKEKNAICSPFMISELWRLNK